MFVALTLSRQFLLTLATEALMASRIHMGGQDSLVDKALDYRPKGTGFDPRLDHKRRST
jgi:hypothetical protein